MSTPTEVALARHWRMDVNMGPDLTPDWQLCPAITEFQPTWPPNFEDSTTYDSEGWEESTKTSQSWQIEATFNRKVSEDSTTFSTVHEKLRTVSFGFDAASKVGVRFYKRDGSPEAYSGTVLVEWEDQGGDYKALGQVKVTLKGTGQLNLITNPVTP
ncbi:hypothetical protein LG634_24605 [Streptomyces bambusae]|uniref:phage tail tube protein n=1 Tax=Streptomyces bambusae TaxID=1550616 RepID=UPI001CFDEE43|nr:hypothetical protein [Streptomyces bambusae]MCB5167995.1 hypothetical protein [Streptomyces bambusae]